MKTLESNRIRFRKITEDDLDDLAALYADPDVMRYYPRTRTREETHEAIKTYQKKYETEKVCLMAAIHKRENKFIGRCGIMLQEIEGEVFPEVGYMLDKFFWRGGLGTEAAIAFRDYGFKELNYPKIISIIHPLNLASQGVAKNMGMTFERTAIYDTVECQIYSITREEWMKICAAQEETKTPDVAPEELHTERTTKDLEGSAKTKASEDAAPKKSASKNKAKQSKSNNKKK
ncbi:MAG: GNAT family N-acetyltransferase [Candidatus Melainabacteria bacterium]|nr:GNAT family N-acetyltransferase [Candidatus Melainabacteria bacterium]